LKKEGKMKKILLATSALAMTAGFAAAEVTLSGDARMGVIDNFGDDNTGFTSRARVKFTLSGETDGGLSFGASFRADNANTSSSSLVFDDANADGVVDPGELTLVTTSGGAVNGRAGEVFISGAFGKLTMGDIDGAAQQAVGNVDGVGLTGLSDLNEAVYLHNVLDLSGTDPSAAYEYSTGAFTGIISVQNPDNNLLTGGADLDPTYALGMKYVAGDYTFALGYENNGDVNIDHVILGVTGTFGAVSLKANYGRASSGGFDADQFHLSATYTADALAVTAFYSDEDDFGVLGQGTAYGLGASYDLGGGAKVVGGYAKNDTADTDAFDLGLSFAF
jgi:outer membrane protein OmpU